MKIYILIILSFLTATAYAQDFKLAKSSGRLEINIGRVDVEGYNGNEIVFSSSERDHDKDERAAGLKEINSLGLEDNTGLGINVSDKGGVITVQQLRKMNSPKITIKVPKGVIISYKYESQYGGEVTFKNVESEIEVSAQYNNVELENCSGPVTVKTIYGHVEASFNESAKGPISIISVYGFADVALPATTKANLKMSTSYGEILVAPEFKIDIEKQENNMISRGNRVSGKINGGGMSIDLNCNYGKVYLRKR